MKRHKKTRLRLQQALDAVDAVLLDENANTDDLERICESAVPILADFVRLALRISPEDMEARTS